MGSKLSKTRLAQVNVALFRWPLSDPRMASFVGLIDQMNHLAESSPGFIWRFDGDYDPVGRPSPFDNQLLFFNLSVWQDEHSLRAYVFDSGHRQVLQRRSEWTMSTGSASLAMWQIDETDAMPTVDDAISRLITRENKSRDDVFTFSKVARN